MEVEHLMDHGRYLARCVELAREALDDGDDPFGSVLVDSAANVVAESRNRERSLADPTAHPELDLAQWAWRNLDARERSAATVYTSGEHCPMCAAAHGWVGLGGIVYAASAAQLTRLAHVVGLAGLSGRSAADHHRAAKHLRHRPGEPVRRDDVPAP